MTSSSDKERARHVLVGVTGSVAAIKVPELIELLSGASLVEIETKLVATKAACHFFDPSKLSIQCYLDEDEWVWSQKGDPVLHIELRKWADVMVIAPLDANTMAKMANGLCDNLLTCVVRAWDCRRPLLYCPAMNTHMWEHPLTAAHLHALSELGYVQVPPVAKVLACGDQGIGAMASVSQITDEVLNHLTAHAND